MTDVRTRNELVEVLATLRALKTHATSLIGDKATGTAIVHDVVKRHPRSPCRIEDRTLYAILKEVTDHCRDALDTDNSQRDFEKKYAQLPFEARACLSLRINFNLSFIRIGRILSLSGRDAECLYAGATIVLESVDKRKNLKN